MKKGIATLFLTLILGCSASAYAGESSFLYSNISSDIQENTMTIEVIINNRPPILLENIPTEGYLDVYSIIGVRVTNVNLKKVVANWTLDLPKGIYILKAGRVVKKIIVR